MKPYIYKTTVRFSDTDLYGVVHHSNYFKWLEEARIQAMEDLIGLTVDWMEENTIRFPVISVEGKYKKSVLARQSILVNTYLYCSSAAKLLFCYDITDCQGIVYFVGETNHAITKDNKLLLKMPCELENRIKGKMKDNEKEYFISWKN